MNTPLGTSDIASTPQAGPSSAVRPVVVVRQTVEDLLEGAFAVPLRDMNT